MTIIDPSQVPSRIGSNYPDRTPNDTANYPDDDLVAIAIEQGWQFTHKDGKTY